MYEKRGRDRKDKSLNKITRKKRLTVVRRSQRNNKLIPLFDNNTPFMNLTSN